MAEYKPRLASRFVGTLTQLLSTHFSQDVEADIPAFEKVVRICEQETGKGLDDQLKVGIVMNAVTDPGLKDHLIRNAGRSGLQFLHTAAEPCSIFRALHLQTTGAILGLFRTLHLRIMRRAALLVLLSAFNLRECKTMTNKKQ